MSDRAKCIGAYDCNCSENLIDDVVCDYSAGAKSEYCVHPTIKRLSFLEQEHKRLQNAIIENCRLCKWRQRDKCPTKENLDRSAGDA